jgi:hypothetical protein
VGERQAVAEPFDAHGDQADAAPCVETRAQDANLRCARRELEEAEGAVSAARRYEACDRLMLVTLACRAGRA